ncbi:hypothetical protein [Streptomyces shenzhenensis]|uniref:Uncharacterized protein n=1 Tax=Streptomyces shenzhenensis TaxID=943815 RepID=A0A3M0I630_9ACTN|nr:hypothetical protein [Streptomyces shenzhenensis]RMB83660.1 hypothetical protein CTZ28_23370 [Streptomyces shenzhenensis]
MIFKVRPDTTRLAQDAYEAYVTAVNGTSVNGDTLPEWDALSRPVQNAWKLSAEAVRHRVELNA